MLKTLYVSALACALSLSVVDASAQKRQNDFPRASPNAAISQTVGVTDISVTYARPSVKGRVVFGELEKFGKAWRVGANEATTISFAHNVKIEGKPLSAGTYAFLAIPHNQTDWTIIINAVANMWGAYVHDSTKDVLRVNVKSQPTEHKELLTFEFTDVTPKSATLNFSWAKTRVPVKIEVNTENIIRSLAAMNTAETVTGKEFFQYARMAYSSDFMTEDALVWSKKALEFEQSYDRLAIAARLHARAGKYADAVTYAERALAADQSKKTEPGVWPALNTLIPEWKSKQ
jgi:hypothetical protein